MNEHDLAFYRNVIRQRDEEIRMLQEVVVKYGDRYAMSNANPMELQQAIDRAFEARS